MKRHAAVIGLGFGDEGKGTLVDHLTSRHSPYGPRHFSTVVRFNGGAQAGHRVVHNGTAPHIFASFGSGFFNGLNTHHSEHMLVNPLAILTEAEALDRQWVGHAMQHLTIDRRALVTTDFHIGANRAAERARGDARHGSCGMGIGETVRFSLLHPDDALRVGDLQDKKVLRRKLWALHDFYVDTVPSNAMPSIDDSVGLYSDFANWSKIVDENYLPIVMANSNVIFEGAQGVLLDQSFGTHPHTTWSRTTTENIPDMSDVEVVGVIRAYMTRHGRGPFPTEVERYGREVPDAANVDGQWQEHFRVGNFDLVLARYASAVLRHLGTPIDQVALTNTDRVPAGMTYAGAYAVGDQLITNLTVPTSRPEQESFTDTLVKANPVAYQFGETEESVDAIAEALGAPITVLSDGPRAEQKRLRRLVSA